MKVLLLDAAFAAEPIYDALLAAGHDVWVMGARAQDLLAVRASDRWIQQDYSKADEVSDVVRRMGFDRVLPGCTDVSLETCVQLTQSVFVGDSADVNGILSEKSRFRQLCELLDLPAPRAVKREGFPRTGTYICKPVDAFSGRGISIFDGEDLAALACAIQSAEAAGRGGGYVIENYCTGQLYSCSAFLSRQQVDVAFYVKEGGSVNPYAVDTSHVVRELPEPVCTELTQGIQRMAEHLGLVDGLIHLQFIIADGHPYIVEVTRRCPGDLYSRLIELSTGYPYAARFAAAFTGDVLSAPNRHSVRYVLRHTVASETASVYQGLHFKSAQPVIGFSALMAAGGSLLAKQANRAGVLFCEYESLDGLDAAYRAYLTRTVYSIC